MDCLSARLSYWSLITVSLDTRNLPVVYSDLFDVVQHLTLADHVLVLEDGSISLQGTFAEIKQSGYDLAHLASNKKPPISALDVEKKHQPKTGQAVTKKDETEDDETAEQYTGGGWTPYKFIFFSTGKRRLVIYLVRLFLFHIFLRVWVYVEFLLLVHSTGHGRCSSRQPGRWRHAAQQRRWTHLRNLVGLLERMVRESKHGYICVDRRLHGVCVWDHYLHLHLPLIFYQFARLVCLWPIRMG